MFFNKKKGNIGEALARKFLENHGYKIVETNYRTKIGEIDIIAKEKDVIIFVEVKFRASLKYGSPKEAINFSKINNIKKVATQYLKQNNIYDLAKVRFDCIEIVGDLQDFEIEHIKNIF